MRLFPSDLQAPILAGVGFRPCLGSCLPVEAEETGDLSPCFTDQLSSVPQSESRSVSRSALIGYPVTPGAPVATSHCLLRVASVPCSRRPTTEGLRASPVPMPAKKPPNALVARVTRQSRLARDARHTHAPEQGVESQSQAAQWGTLKGRLARYGASGADPATKGEASDSGPASPGSGQVAAR